MQIQPSDNATATALAIAAALVADDGNLAEELRKRSGATPDASAFHLERAKLIGRMAAAMTGADE